jgi:very-short-patch-repair endonuclease
VIAGLAERQHGVMSRQQLLAAGVSDEAIQLRLALKRLCRVHAGVYEIGGRKHDQTSLFIAAVLAGGHAAALSHRSAAAHWGLRSQSAGAVEISVPRGAAGGRRKGLRVHESRTLEAEDVTVHDGIRCTTVARTLVDLAAALPTPALRGALEQAVVLRLFDKHAIEAALARANGRRGTKTLRTLLAELADDPPPTRSELERCFLDLIRSAALPSPVTNGFVCGYEVDFHWPEAKLIVETDGAATHDTPLAFHRDRQRDLDLELAGWHVLRITWRQLTREPGKVVALLRRRL